jgi:hypothetical protein
LKELNSIGKFRLRATTNNTLEQVWRGKATTCYWRATGAANRVASGDDALLLLSLSERAFTDLLYARLALGEDDNVDDDNNVDADDEDRCRFEGVYLVVRPWIDIRFELEFRCFAVDRKLGLYF